jgi:hypothetical protein
LRIDEIDMALSRARELRRDPRRGQAHEQHDGHRNEGDEQQGSAARARRIQ